MHPCPVDQLVRQVNIVLQVVLVLGLAVPADGARHVSGVAQRPLCDGAVDRADGVDAEEHIVEVVERIEHAEDVDSRSMSFLGKLPHDVVRVGSVPHRVGAAEEHLERNVGHRGAQLLEAPPGALVQEAQRDIKGGPSPDLERGRGRQSVCRERRGADEVVGADPRGEQRLVRVAHRGVCDEEPPVSAHGGGPPLGAAGGEDVLPACGRGGVARGGGLAARS